MTTPNIIPSPAPRGRLIVAPDTPVDQWPTTLDRSQQSAVIMLNGQNAPDMVLGENGSVEFFLANVFAHPAERLDEDSGELHQFSRLVMIDPQGRTFATTSEPVAHRVAALIDLVAVGRITLPALVRIRERKGRKSGRIYHELTVILNGEA